MKKILFAIALAMCIGSGNALAQWSIGSSVGTMSVKFDEVDVDDSPVNAGILLGYHFTHWVQGLSIELEVTRTVTEGTVENVDLSVESQGLYVVYRTSHPVYAKVRLGIMEAALTGDFGEDEGGETYGVGVGWRFNRFGVELDYTSIDDDVIYTSLGVNYRF